MHKLSFAVIAKRNQTFLICHYDTTRSLCQAIKCLIIVRVAPATSDVQSILDIPVTDEIHMED